ncbi:hypothetical protein F1C58_14290 [Glaciihabitans sp. INWT7]|uniref:hypothetical protein n=1 Tax=Glaciihabitans sp. INWT7 TaxID=2596912 RepID=UPI0016293D33|nr:hypothetical protein [Glaciihabitans sp. INWT7]QNE47950.1 hypothetical protein F1C58_14290 [Glaciihabitans sp. INWT7]
MTRRHRVVSAAMAATLVVLLSGCAFAVPSTRTTDPALVALAAKVAEIDGVQDAAAVPSYDGSPTAQRLGIRIYLDEPATGDLAAITTDALRLAWGFRGFTPVSYTVQVWNGPRQSPPYDNTKRVDLTPVLDQLDLPTSRVYKGDLTASIEDLSAKFGARG